MSESDWDIRVILEKSKQSLRQEVLATMRSLHESSPDEIKRQLYALVASGRRYERERIQAIMDAEREWGDFHPDDIKKRVDADQGPRLISGWNVPSGYEGDE
jgi:hypothetical protein